jgi:hypothetical protein
MLAAVVDDEQFWYLKVFHEILVHPAHHFADFLLASLVVDEDYLRTKETKLLDLSTAVGGQLETGSDESYGADNEN